ncbi:transferase [Streptomyces sp. uw30]|uniref:transferase n=1 Tax=Streptomyces sp. uw30 TaxID=1828179 RepID=UPI0011CEABAD|nr:transferase [Streptomyces sp. uw30]TXS49243.1 transferase [Streptomyces sp. uw30]
MTTDPAAASAADLRTDCTADADGRITFALRAPSATGRLLLRLRPKKGQPEKILHLLDPEPGEDGRLRAVLEQQPLLAEGRWDVYLLPEPDAPRRRLRPGLRDLRALLGGHLRDWQSSVAVRVPYVTKDGYLAVRAWLRTAHAEVEGIDVTDRSMTVRARLHGATLAQGAAVRLRLRGGGGTERTVVPRAEDDGRGFSFTVDYGELVGDDDTGDRVWDLFVRAVSASTGEETSIRIGRLFDDVADRKEIFVLPAAVIGGAVVRPYYTVDNDLSVLADRT